MRLPEAIRLAQGSGAVAVLLLTAALPARGQFAGGVGDGFATAGLRHWALDGNPMLSPAYTASATGGDGYSSSAKPFIALDGATLPVPLFTATASGGDGYSNAGSLFLRLDGNAPPPQLFTATNSGGDGYATAGLLNRAMDGTSAFLASFKGGGGDGYDKAGLENKSIDPGAASFVIYNGGSGDGYDDDGVRHAGLGGMAGFGELFAGGGGDGYDTAGALNQPVDGNSATVVLFLSSAAGGDGYDDERAAFVPLDGASIADFAFLGNIGDGYSSSGFLHVLLTPAPLPPSLLFAGGSGDGYDTVSLPFVQYMGGGDVASGITFAGWLNSRFSEEERADGLADPAADPDDDGLPNLIEFALGSDPREPDAAAFGPEFRLSNLSDFGYPALADRHLTVIVRRNPLALNVTLRVEVTEETSSLWSVNETVQVDSSPSVFIVRDQFGIMTAPRRAMRLRATLNP